MTVKDVSFHPDGHLTGFSFLFVSNGQSATYVAILTRHGWVTNDHPYAQDQNAFLLAWVRPAAKQIEATK